MTVDGTLDGLRVLVVEDEMMVSMLIEDMLADLGCTVVGPASRLDEAIALANAHGYGLSSAIYTTSPKHAFRFRERVTAGMVSVNNSTSGAEAHLPFGGNGRSGNGSRQSGMWVLDQFTRWQSMNWDYSGRLQRAQMDTLQIEPDPGFRLPG